MMDYAMLQLRICVTNIGENYNAFIKSLEGKGKLVIVEKTVHMSGTNISKNFMEIWYHVSDIPDHEKVIICHENESAFPFIMDVPAKTKRFTFGNMPEYGAYDSTCRYNGYRKFWLKESPCIGNETHKLQISFEDAKRHFHKDIYEHHLNYVPQDNET